MLICRIKGSRCALSQGKYRNESKSRRMTEVREAYRGVFIARLQLYTQVHRRTRIRTPSCKQLWKLSRGAECLRAVRKLSASSESVARGWWWKRKDRRLKCRFRATLEPRKHLNLLCSHSHAFCSSLALATLTTTVHLFPILDLWHPAFLIFSPLVSSCLLPRSCHSSSVCPTLRFT